MQAPQPLLFNCSAANKEPYLTLQYRVFAQKASYRIITMQCSGHKNVPGKVKRAAESFKFSIWNPENKLKLGMQLTAFCKQPFVK